MISYWIEQSELAGGILIPKYYDPALREALDSLSQTHKLLRIGDLIAAGAIDLATGDEIGSESYGTGNIPFVRTSDISNWEIKSAPKLGVSEEVFARYAAKQAVEVGDILLVRDGTYLIGTNCFVTEADTRILFQSHILRIRVLDRSVITPEEVFLALNGDLVQRQIRSVQFTADIIDTIGRRVNELLLPVPIDAARRKRATDELRVQLDLRAKGRCFVKQAPLLIEQALASNSATPLSDFLAKPVHEIADVLVHDTVTLEFGGFEAAWVDRASIQDQIFLPKYYDPEIEDELAKLAENCDVLSISELQERSLLAKGSGDEPGKMAYGTGEIPFIRTSDFANWELKHDPKQGLAPFIYEGYREKQDVRPLDIFVVRDGTWLVGSSTIVTKGDEEIVFCGGLVKLRTLDENALPPYLLLALLNTYVVKRQMRSKQFTRDVIDTLGRRLDEVRLPVPRSPDLRQRIDDLVRGVVDGRLSARNRIKDLCRENERA